MVATDCGAVIWSMIWSPVLGCAAVSMTVPVLVWGPEPVLQVELEPVELVLGLEAVPGLALSTALGQELLGRAPVLEHRVLDKPAPVAADRRNIRRGQRPVVQPWRSVQEPAEALGAAVAHNTAAAGNNRAWGNTAADIHRLVVAAADTRTHRRVEVDKPVSVPLLEEPLPEPVPHVQQDSCEATTCVECSVGDAQVTRRCQPSLSYGGCRWSRGGR